jgi:hypothetical protein
MILRFGRATTVIRGAFRRTPAASPLSLWPALAWVVLAWIALPATAAEVPASAFTGSLACEPDLPAHPGLVFLHPQRAVLEPRQILVLGTSSRHPASGGLWALGSHRAFLLSQRGDLAINVYRGTPDLHATSVLRFGWAAPLGRWRAGLSASGEAWKDSEVEESLEYNDYTRSYEYTYDVREWNWRAGDLLLGIGAGTGRTAFDLVWETRWEKRDDGLIHATQTSRATDTLIVSFEADKRPIPGVHLRAQAPLSRSVDLIVLGDWTGREERRPGRFQGALFDVEVDSSRVEAGWRDSWRAALGARTSFPKLDLVMLSIAYRYERTPLFLAGGSGPSRTDRRLRRLTLATSVQEPLWKALEVSAGLQRTYDLTEVTTEEVGYLGERYEIGSRRDDDMENRFRWGLGWSWRNLRLNGELSSNLNVSYLFSTLDVRILF